jgi:hypothetical protein
MSPQLLEPRKQCFSSPHFLDMKASGGNCISIPADGFTNADMEVPGLPSFTYPAVVMSNHKHVWFAGADVTATLEHVGLPALTQTAVHSMHCLQLTYLLMVLLPTAEEMNQLPPGE